MINGHPLETGLDFLCYQRLVIKNRSTNCISNSTISILRNITSCPLHKDLIVFLSFSDLHGVKTLDQSILQVVIFLLMFHSLAIKLLLNVKVKPQLKFIISIPMGQSQGKNPCFCLTGP